MKEKNHHVLASALSELSEYQAPESVWEQIEHALQNSQKNTLQEKMRELPRYTAPDHIWSRIQGELRGRRRPFYLKTWGIAAIFVLLLSLAGIWKMLDKEKMVVVPPMTEKKVPLSEMSDIQIVDFENQMASQEAELKICIETSLKDSILPELQTEILQLEELTNTRDSLSFFLTSGKGLPGTSPRMDRLESKRILLIKKLRKQLCGKE